jgi:hypothetical protein
MASVPTSPREQGVEYTRSNRVHQGADDADDLPIARGSERTDFAVPRPRAPMLASFAARDSSTTASG